ncbi:hypothetical protein [Streptomyces sp. NPDC058084]|uniref:hypothetical protein n=1 Tax=Streptomyces sp. NPDC058084 TaxID=3346333 RepID=UPI0036EA4027
MIHKIDDSTTLGELWAVAESLADVCASAGEHLPHEELKALQVGKVAEEAGEAMHALHGLKGLTTCGAECGEAHSWAGVSNDLTGAVLAAMIGLRYINGPKAREEFAKVMFRRTRRGREAMTPAS